jgi:hypothetical protein
VAAAPPQPASSPTAAPAKSDYGRWTVNGASGSGRDAAPARGLLLCDVAHLAALSDDERSACLKAVKTTEGAVLRDRRARDWTSRTHIPCQFGKGPSDRGLSLDLCNGASVKLRF